ncbi:MAG: hypothetical protein AUG49_11160 [Catenulispora sp. 13_1_20CM_3_70_7]|nr:MAG: hypothetical protein AUG49_11160 [Catenulispora sp. 13_1_20CM_3_70_7]
MIATRCDGQLSHHRERQSGIGAGGTDHVRLGVAAGEVCKGRRRCLRVFGDGEPGRVITPVEQAD